MMRSLFSAVSGLNAHQLRMDVIGNNIANINTPGFKKSRVTFQDMLYQTIRGASRGTNPMQVGPGVTIASIDTICTPGNLQNTGKTTDLGIDGDGFFVLSRDGGRRLYTRVGNFDFDSEGYLVSLLNGMKVQGWLPPDPNADIRDYGDDYKKESNLQAIKIDFQEGAPAKATSEMVFAGNLDFRANNGILKFKDSGTTTDDFIVIYDPDGDPSSGNEKQVEMRLTFTPTNSFNTWNWEINVIRGGTITSGGSGTVELDSEGNVVHSTGSVEIDVDDDDVAEFMITPPTSGSPNGFTPRVTGGGSESVGFGTGVEGISATDFTAPGIKLEQTVYDELGNTYNVAIRFVKRDENGNWDWEVESITNSKGEVLDPVKNEISGSGSLKFDGSGKLISGDVGAITFDPDGTGDLNKVVINVDFSRLTQYAAEFTAVVESQDGYPAGTLESYTIDQTGTIVGVYSNGVSRGLAQVALVRFTNPAGLTKEGSSLFAESSNSGEALFNVPGAKGYGTIKPGSIEMSNVDVSAEFAELIITQRGFQANSRVITASDEMLQELVNLKR